MMESTLLSNSNSEEFQNENLLTNRPNRVSVVVENIEDVDFWYDLLNHVCNDKFFEINPYQIGDRLTNGKEHILRDTNRYGKHMIACVDSDYDYLLPDISHYNDALQCDHVIQTIAYSYENLICDPHSLNRVCVNAVKCSSDFDFLSFFNDLSATLYPLLLWVLYLQKIGDFETFKIANDWKLILECNQSLYKKTQHELIQNVESNVYSKIIEIKKVHGDKQHEVDDLAVELKNILVQENAYMFVYGHALFNYVKDVIIVPECKRLKNHHLQMLKDNAVSEKQLKENKRHYNECCRDYETSLRDNFEYKHANPFVPLIVDRIQAALE